MSRLSPCCVLFLLAACGTPASAPQPASAPAPAPARAAPNEPPRARVEIPCETPSDCATLLTVCPRAHPHNAGNCIRPYSPTGEHLLGVCSNAHCEVDDEVECNGAAARCIGGGEATFQAYDPPDPDYRRGGCTVRCTSYPETSR